MKFVSLLLAALVIAFSLPACATAKKKDQCCGGASCDAPAAKSQAHSHSHGKKKAS